MVPSPYIFTSKRNGNGTTFLYDIKVDFVRLYKTYFSFHTLNEPYSSSMTENLLLLSFQTSFFVLHSAKMWQVVAKHLSNTRRMEICLIQNCLKKANIGLVYFDFRI